MYKLNMIDWIALILVIIGAVNWGLIGAFNFNLVAAIFGVLTPLARLIYVIVGVAGIYTLFMALRNKKNLPL